jgi:hypothetical protein
VSELDFQAVVEAVRQNCHISDAQFAGDLTLCTFLLKMRELYRWENAIPLSQEMPRSEVGEWMNVRGQLWDAIEARPYVAVPLGSGQADPFESQRINAALLEHGYVYSGGYGRHCKPHFFLADLLRRETRHGFDIYVCGREHARDLEAPPGMYLDRTIFLRSEALRRWLWEKYEEWRWSRKNEAMGRALGHYPFERDPEVALAAITATEMEPVILHELGEARVGEALGDAWEGLLAEVMRSRAEIMARAVRDLYADCLSTLPQLIERAEPASLHFYFANFVGMRRKLFPELADAYQAWVDSGELAGLRAAASRGLEQWQGLAEEMLALHRERGEAVRAEIEARLDRRLAC